MPAHNRDCKGQPEIEGYYPGLIGDMVSLHGAYYAENWGLDLSFEAQEAQELGQFMLGFNPSRDGVWAMRDSRGLLGALAIDGSEASGPGARLRWFIVRPGVHGGGLGWRLLQKALAFCREQQHPRVHLWTFQGLDAAKRLYLRAGFELKEDRLSDIWGKQVLEQRYDLIL